MISKNKILYTILFLFLLTKFSSAQFYSTGADPASAKWEQIKSDHFQIIFQESFVKQAQHVANVLEYYYKLEGKTLNHQPKKVSVILHNQTIRSNGYVAWAPKRMELYASPSPDEIPDPFLEHLCIHELRHVVQIDKLNQGITKILSLVFGQQATGLVAGQLPLWYYEGDAVCTETAFGEFGRGRTPSFNRNIKTILLSDDKNYSFDKMLFGSYKDFVPNHYEFGYQLTSYARNKYGSEIWSDVENYTAKNSYTLLPTPFAFYRGLKKYTGLSQKGLYQETSDYLDSVWTIESLNDNKIDPKLIQNYSINEYEDYINPIYIDDSNYIALKKGLSHIPQFVLINKSSEKVIFEPGTLLSNDFSYAHDILVWAEYKPDKRWQNREFNSIRLLNIKTGLTYTLIKKSRFFSPAFSPVGDKIAVVEVDKENKSCLVILNTFNGKVLERIESHQNNLIQRPVWGEDGKSIFVIELDGSKKQVTKYDLRTDKWNVVFQADQEDIQRILPTKNQIYYHSTLNGTDNLYVFDRDNSEKYQLSSSRFGISEFDLSANKSELLVNEYTSHGFRLAKIPVERALWKKMDSDTKYKYQFVETLKKQEGIFNKYDESDQKEFDVKPFRKPLNLFNFHSWVPAYIDYNNIHFSNIIADPSEIYGNIYPGIMLLSQNKLSTVESNIAYAYKNGNHVLSSSVTFKGQYPVIRLSANYGDDQKIQTTSNAWIPETKPGYSYNLDIYVPFNFSRGKFVRGFRPLASIEYFDNLYYNFQNDYYIRGLEFVQTGLLFYSYQRKAERDIIPKLGAIFDFNLFNTPFDKELYGYLYNIDGLFYLPGGKNNGIKIDLGYQFQKPVLYLFNTNFDFPRGIRNKRTEKLFKMYGDYVFPIAYPDWNLGSALYIKRIKGDFFADYALNQYRVINSSQTAIKWNQEQNLSCGLELSIDYHLLRMMFPLNTGIRIGYALTENNLFAELLFGIDLYR